MSHTEVPHYGEVSIITPGLTLPAHLCVPPGAEGLVLVVDGNHGPRHAPRRRYMVGILNAAGFATLLLDPLSAEERAGREACFDVDLLGRRLEAVLAWAATQPRTAALTIGLFGTSAGATAALAAAARRPQSVAALVACGGRPDLLGPLLRRVRTPALLVVDSRHEPLFEAYRDRHERPGGAHIIEVVPGASYPFDERTKLEEATHLARDWFRQYLSYRPAWSRGTALEANER